MREKELERFIRENTEILADCSTRDEIWEFIKTRLDKIEDVVKRTNEEKCKDLLISSAAFRLRGIRGGPAGKKEIGSDRPVFPSRKAHRGRIRVIDSKRLRGRGNGKVNYQDEHLNLI